MGCEDMPVIYKDTKDVSAEEVARLFFKSGINRPHEDLERIRRIIDNSDIIITAWVDERMVGVARALTDYSYCCYLSDLAVDADFQRSGIGRKMVEIVREKIGDECSLILIAAPNAADYYPKIGFERTDKAFLIKRKK